MQIGGLILMMLGNVMHITLLIWADGDHSTHIVIYWSITPEMLYGLGGVPAFSLHWLVAAQIAGTFWFICVHKRLYLIAELYLVRHIQIKKWRSTINQLINSAILILTRALFQRTKLLNCTHLLIFVFILQFYFRSCILVQRSLIHCRLFVLIIQFLF